MKMLKIECPNQTPLRIIKSLYNISVFAPIYFAVCLFYSGFTSFSTIFQSYRDRVWKWQGTRCSFLEYCLTKYALQTLDMITTCSSTLLMLSVNRGTSWYRLKYLVWLGLGSNPQPPGQKASALHTEPLCRWYHYENTPIQIHWKFHLQKRKIIR